MAAAAAQRPSVATGTPASEGKHRELPAAEAPGGAPERVQLDYPGHDIWLHVTSEPERRWRTRACAKEPWTVEWIEAVVRPGGVFYDVGANVGAFSLIAAKHCDDDLTVVAFEPGYSSYARLCDNIVLNGCDRSIIPVPLPLAATTGLAGFKYRSLHPGQSRHAFSPGVPKPGRTKDRPDTRYRQPVLAMRLDDLICHFKLPLPNHMKIDVDGGELLVLQGASGVLASAGLRSILIEIDRALAEPVTAVLVGKGFSLTRTHEREGKKDDAPLYCVFDRRT
jgi:FkbM family methyltransferase